MPLSGPELRRSQRILATVPLTVTGESASGMFIEETNSLVVNAHGALITLSEKVSQGQHLNLKNNKTMEEVECRVVFSVPAEQGGHRVGVEFTRSVADFWHIPAPPQDWLAHTY